MMTEFYLFPNIIVCDFSKFISKSVLFLPFRLEIDAILIPLAKLKSIVPSEFLNACLYSPCKMKFLSKDN